MKVNGKEIKWEDAPKGWFPGNVKMHVLWRDEKTGASLALLRAPKGKWWDKAHAHSSANEFSIIFAGEMEVNGTHWKGSADDIMFSVSTQDKIHGEGVGKVIEEVTWIRYLDGPATRVDK